MDFTFHLSDTSSDTGKLSKKHEHKDIEWTVELISRNEVVIKIGKNPIGGTICPLVPWTITFDVLVLKTGSSCHHDDSPRNSLFFFEQEEYFQEHLSEEREDVVLSEELNYVSLDINVEPSVNSLKVEISNIRIKGFHNFEMKNFDSADAKEDLVLKVNGGKLHCHSQILSWNSKIFRTMIEESKVSSEICLKKTIPVEDLRELLHYLYLPCEPVDDHNFRKLLHWGHKFEVNHIVRLCHQYMESLVLGSSTTDAIRIEIFLLSWRYSNENLKNMYAKKQVPLKSSGWMMKIVQTEVYQDMDKDLKLQMWESVIETFEY